MCTCMYTHMFMYMSCSGVNSFKNIKVHFCRSFTRKCYAYSRVAAGTRRQPAPRTSQPFAPRLTILKVTCQIGVEPLSKVVASLALLMVLKVENGHFVQPRDYSCMTYAHMDYSPLTQHSNTTCRSRSILVCICVAATSFRPRKSLRKCESALLPKFGGELKCFKWRLKWLKCAFMPL